MAKKIKIPVWVVMFVDSDGDIYAHTHKTEEDAFDLVYRVVAENWDDMFDEDDIDDFTEAEAVSRYYDCSDDRFEIQACDLEYTVQELQDIIYKVIALETNDGT